MKRLTFKIIIIIITIIIYCNTYSFFAKIFLISYLHVLSNFTQGSSSDMLMILFGFSYAKGMTQGTISNSVLIQV